MYLQVNYECKFEVFFFFLSRKTRYVHISFNVNVHVYMYVTLFTKFSKKESFTIFNQIFLFTQFVSDVIEIENLLFSAAPEMRTDGGEHEVANILQLRIILPFALLLLVCTALGDYISTRDPNCKNKRSILLEKITF